MERPSTNQPPPATDEPDSRCERALMGSHDGFWERNLRTNVSWYSQSFRALFGFAPDELPNDAQVREAVNARIHPDDIAGFLATYEDAIRKLRSFSYEVRFRDKLDRWRWVRGRGKVWAGADGRAEIVAGALTDVHEEKEAQGALAALTRRFQRAVSAADEAVFERTVGSDELYVSDRFAQLLGYQPAEMPRLRSEVLKWIHPQDRARFDADNEQGLARLGRWTMNYRLRCSDGEYRWFREHAIAERDAGGLVRVTGVIADVHNQVLAQQQLDHHHEQLELLVRERTARLQAALALAEQKRAEADRANQAKSLFLAHMSHEIRTPLNGVLGLNELALHGAETEVQRRYLQLALQSGRSLLNVINDVLDFSRVEAGKLSLKQAPFDLAETVAEAMRAMTPLRQQNVRFMYDYLGEFTTVLGDEARMRQVLTNLLGNAVKFTDHGHVTVVTTLRAEQLDRCQAEIVVTDTGVGMDAATLARVFDPFVQGDDSVSRRHGGTGLGLSIAQGLARTMGGQIEARSELGVGSSFTLRLPLLRAPDSATLPLPALPGHAWLIYPVDVQARWNQRRLVRLGWTARVMHSIEEALRTPQSPVPELLMVPGHLSHDSRDLANLRAALPDARIVLVLRPDRSLLAMEQAAGSLKIDIALAPLTPQELLRLTAPLAAQRPPTSLLPEAATGRPSWQGARVMLVEDNPVNRLIGEEMLATLGVAVEAVESGMQALDRCRIAPPDLMLLDVQMPEMDGYETCRRLRKWQARGELPRFPIVALTAHALPADREASHAAGMDGFLTKPIDLATLQAELAHRLAVRRTS